MFEICTRSPPVRIWRGERPTSEPMQLQRASRQEILHVEAI